jgi:hypothetical protein
MNFSRERCLCRNNCAWIVDEESLREVLVCEGADLFVSSRQDRRTMPRVVSVAGYDVNRVALKQENCRIAVSVSLATAQTSLPATYQLYLPEIWANDAERRRKVGVPAEVRFQTKPEIALAQIRSLADEDVPRGVVLADAAYGNDNGFRDGLETLGFAYVVGIQSSTSVWPPGIAPLPPQARSRMGADC